MRLKYNRDVYTDEIIIITINSTLISNKTISINSYILSPHPRTAIVEEIRPARELFEFELVFPENIREILSIEIDKKIL